jgi:hypothetical protein
MTEPIDRMAQSRFVENDDGYKLVRERHNKMHQAARSAKQDILLELRKIDILLSAFNLCVEKAWEHEDIAEDSELDKQLKRLTPDGSEIWFSHYTRGADLIKQQMLLAQWQKLIQNLPEILLAVWPLVIQDKQLI